MNQFTNERGELMDITQDNLSYVTNTFLFKYSQLCQKMLATFTDAKAIQNFICRGSILYFDINESEYTIALALHILKQHPEITFSISMYDGTEIVLELSENNAQYFLDNIFTTEPFKHYQRIMNSATLSYDMMPLSYLVNAYFTRRFEFLKSQARSHAWDHKYLRTMLFQVYDTSAVYCLKHIDTEFTNLYNGLDDLTN